MIGMVIWALLTVGIFVWNGTGQHPFIGVRFTEPAVNGGWLGLTVFFYTVARVVYRRAQDRKRTSRGQG